ncbi:MAG: class B sortase [Lachnospiraceae bacterium]|nr:class B sortase [Lachnospiraceae bacterium]MDY4971538.1 class B sortase [Lachnospiraceae bacterium]
MKKFIQTLLLILCIGVFYYSAWQLYCIWQEYHAGDEIYDSVQEEVALPSSEQQEDSRSPQDETVEDSSVLRIPDSLINLELLQQINSDAIGWIRIPDTNINYPILQAEDNKLYLRRTITGEYNKAGCIFVDCRTENAFQEANTIVYGHNLLNGKMFSNLMKYEDQDWYQEHPYVYIQTSDGVQVYEIYSCYRTWDSSPAYTFNLETGTDSFQDYLDETTNQSLYTTGIIPDSSDRIITLSTCTNESDDERFVVHGRLITR